MGFALSRIVVIDDFIIVIHPCHFERSEKSKIGNRFVCIDFRILTAFGMIAAGGCETVLVGRLG